jgi:hypothetical protein
MILEANMKILCITDPYPNYVPDLILHGLRKLIGPDVVDYPRKECVYNGVLGLGVCPENQLCPNWFPSDDGQIDREDIWQKVSKGYFTYVICDYRAVPVLAENLSDWPTSLIIIDGEDAPVKIPPGKYVICRRETDGSDFSIPLPVSLPEEVLNWIASYDTVPKEHNIGFLGCISHGERKRISDAIAQVYPDTLFQIEVTGIPSDSDPFPEGRVSRDDYYLNLQKCRIVLNLPGAGWDTFRFWENAACNAVHISERMPFFIPNDFVEEEHILRFSSVDELKKAVDRVLEEKANPKEIIRNGREHLVNFHLTTKRAQYLLDRAERAFAL